MNAPGSNGTGRSLVDPALCRDTIARLVADESATLTQLVELLDTEHATLVANDPDALERAGDARHAHVTKLLRIEDERRSLCRMLGMAPDAKGLEKLLAWCDPQGTLKAAWARCAALAGECRDRNDRNGALVAARLRRVEGVLGALKARGESHVYGRQGLALAGKAGQVLATEA